MTATRKNTLGERLITAAKEAVQIERGATPPARVSKFTVAETEVDPPGRYPPEQIKRIRSRMVLSQSVFAAALNVSPETVKAWEQGKREPDGPSLRLLEVAEEHPQVLLARVRVVAS
ncbi:MAG: helix-turn-helix domain-containing protein [Phycisphaerales bacterium JB040]